LGASILLSPTRGNCLRWIDWLKDRPPVLENVFWQDMDQIQKEKSMPFITTPERVGIRKGLRMGIEALLKVRFGEEGLKLMPEIQEIHEEQKLRAILKTLEAAASPEEVRRLWVPASS
jgi:hypothetical protein